MPVDREGLTTVPSNFGPKETMERLETELRAQGMKIFARIDHAAGAREAGLELRPTEVIIWERARRHTSDAGKSNRRNRFAVKGACLAGRGQSELDFLQRTELDRATTWPNEY